MKTVLTDTFFESFKRMINRQRWYWKVWDFFRYDISRFCKNVWKFRKALSRHYWWDHHGTLMFLEIGIEDMANRIENDGLEVDISRLKKVKAMKRAAELIRNYNEDNYIEMAEAELGEIVHHEWEFEDVPDTPGYSRLVDKDTPEEKEHNRKVFERAREIGEQEWKELWRILQGQDHREYKKISKNLTLEEHNQRDPYYEWFDGTDMRGWWD
jgi:hypothetical protein